jgi:hypothetical protein
MANEGDHLALEPEPEGAVMEGGGEQSLVEGTELSKLEEIIEIEGRGELLQMKESHNDRWRLR